MAWCGGLAARRIGVHAARAKLLTSKRVFVIVGDASVVKPQLDQQNLPVEVIPAPALN